MSLMHEFFQSQLENLELNTGYQQYNNLLKKANWQDELKKLKDLLVLEVDKHPFNVIGIDVKKQIISEAIMGAKDFIGLNPRFVHLALQKWWEVNKNNYLERTASKEQAPEDYKPVTGEARLNWLNTWQKTIENGDSQIKLIQPVPKEIVQIAGQEDAPKEKAITRNFKWFKVPIDGKVTHMKGLPLSKPLSIVEYEAETQEEAIRAVSRLIELKELTVEKLDTL